MPQPATEMDLFTFTPERAAKEAEFPIEKGIEIKSDRSSSRHGKWRKPEFPFHRMQPGDSFLCTPAQCGGAPLIVTQNIVTSEVAKYCKAFKPEDRPKFTTRQVDGAAVRCWRIS